MKLFTKYNRINLLTTLFIFLVTSLVFYYFIRAVLVNQVDDDLEIEKNEIEGYVKQYKQLPEIIPVRHLVITYTEIKYPSTKIRFRTFVASDSSNKNRDNFRSLVFGIRANGKAYEVLVMKPLESTENLLWSILLIILSTILAMLQHPISSIALF